MSIYNDLSASAFGKLLGDELSAYYEALGSRRQRLFYFEGQDPFGHALPAEAIADIYWALDKSAQNRLTNGFIDVLASRTELLPTEALVQIIVSIGLIHRSDMLKPMCRIIGQRSDTSGSLHSLYANAIAILMGFAPKREAFDAIDLLIGYQSFPNDLVYDALEVLILDPNTQWQKSVMKLQSRMHHGYRPSMYGHIENRLAITATLISERLSIKDVADGIEQLIEMIGTNTLISTPSLPVRDPVGMLISALLWGKPSAPFSLETTARGNVIRARAGNEQQLSTQCRALLEVDAARRSLGGDVVLPWMHSTRGSAPSCASQD